MSDPVDKAASELERLRWRVKTLESSAKYAARARPTLVGEERQRAYALAALRDQFAAAAMAGVIVTTPGYEYEDFARECYEHADAMLRERLRTLAAQAKPSEGSVQSDGSVPRSGTENEPAATPEPPEVR